MQFIHDLLFRIFFSFLQIKMKSSFTFKHQKQREQNSPLQILKNVLSMLYHTKNSESRNNVYLDVAAQKPSHQDLPCLQFSYFLALTGLSKGSEISVERLLQMS